MALTGIDALLSLASWDDTLDQPDGYSIEILVEVDARHHEVVLTATCECGHAFGESGHAHPDAAFEAAAELTCPHQPHADN